MFENKVAIITGGSKGIGLGIASALAAQGAYVYLVARNEGDLKKAQEKITSLGGKADIKVGDITDFKSIKEIIDSVYADNGRLDIFVNNAGTWQYHNLDTPFKDIWKLIELDMKAPYEIALYLASKFRQEKENNLQILTTASQASFKVLDGVLGYGPAKMGLTSGLFHIQNELKNEKVENIQLYQIYPNTVATEKIVGTMKKNGVFDAVNMESLANTAIDLLSDKTPTRDIRIGYYKGKGIVRTHLPSNPKDFYHPAPTTDEVINSDFKPEDLLD